MRRALLIGGGAAAALALVGAGLVALLLASAPGHAFVRDHAVRALEGSIDGRVTVGSLSGSLWRLVDLSDVTLATPDGRPVIRAARVRVRYGLLELLRRRYVLHRVELIRPTIVLEQAPDGTWNYRRLFRLDRPRRGPAGRRPLVELVDARVMDGTVVLEPKADAHGVRAERQILGVQLDLRRLRVSHPDSTAIVASVSRLALRSTEPRVQVVKADGDVTVDGDSARFDFDHFELASTRGSAAGRVRWGGGRVSYDIALHARRLSFADVAWLDARMPRTGGGRVVLRAHALPGGAAEFDVRELEVTSGRSAVSGTLRVYVGARGGVRIGAMDLALAPLDLDVLRPLVDTLPVRGLVSGRLRGSGTPGDLAVDASLAFTDEAVAGHPTNTIAGRGHLVLGGAEGLIFRGFAVSRSDLDFSTIRRFAPSFSILGRLGATGGLDGPWRDATFRGTLTHSMAALPTSILRGTLRLGLRDTVRVDADLVADSLSFDLLAASYPWIPLKGLVAGPIALHGPVTALEFDAALSGSVGRWGARGTVGGRDSAVTVRAEGTVDSVDLGRHFASAPPTVLSGRWSVDLTVPTADTTQATTGRVRVALDTSRVAGLGVRRARLVLALTPDHFAVDTALLVYEGGDAEVSGALGRAGRPPAQLTFAFRSDTLARFVLLVQWLKSASRDTVGEVALEGRGSATGRLVGTTAEWEADGSLEVESVRYGSFAARLLRMNGGAAYGAQGWGALDLRVAAESLAVHGYAYELVDIVAAGPLDSLGLKVEAGFRLGSSLRAELVLRAESLGVEARLDSLMLALPERTWRLAAPSVIAATRDSLTIDSLELRAEGAGGRVWAAGSLPRAAVGDFALFADGVPLVDAYALAQRDTAGTGGSLSLTVHVAGSAASPMMDMQFALDDGRFGEFRAPRVEVLGRYADRRLWLKAGLWREGVRVVSANGSLPLDLAFTPVASRQLSDSLEIRIRSDSVDLSVVDALTSLVSNVAGQVSADVTIGGTWEEPQLTGTIDVRDGAVTVPAVGARYTDIDARLALGDNRIRVTEARLRSGGTLNVSGEVRFESLTKPVLDLTLKPRGFAAFNIRDFGALTGSGDLRLRGPALGATLSGSLTVDNGFLAFANLVEKRIVNLDDPEFRAIVDSNLALAADLAPPVQSVFLDSLRIEGLTVAMGPDVWLRSHEANIQLSGEFQVAKAVEDGLPRYRLDGTLNAVRGTYRLTLPATSKEFQVTRGTVRFFGTPDLNPELDIAAQHTLRTLQGGQLVVRAIIGGTLLVPRLTLESDQRPPLSETELVSYLLFGRPSADLVQSGSGTRNQVEILKGTVASLAAGELEQTLVGGLGLPLDYLAIRPAGMPGDVLGLGATRVEAGTQIGERTFLILNAGLCEVRRGATSQILGASVEYRLSQRFRFEASIEPLRECRVTGATTLQSSRYQIGVDLFFQPGQR
ncbi:MAG: translocation/assembly module TamB domain-containing protein [Gemmatimonadales bacterium]|nr:translocation/assembly module TamB domain-containing protein [Gemmatimonadales bacterium]